MNNITDISALSKLTNLTYLDISNNDITNIKPITRLNKLETLGLMNTMITQSDVEWLEACFPDCEIFYNPIW